MSNQVESYTIAWICLTSWERPIALASLDTVYSKQESPLRSRKDDSIKYTFGRHRGHNIVIASGDRKSIPLTHVAELLLKKFYRIRFCLMVGTAGGVPSENHDVRLGDVVVGLPKQSNPGFVEMVLNFIGKGDSRATVDHSGLIPEEILSAITRLKIRHRHTEHTTIAVKLDSLVQEYPRLKAKYNRPSSSQDIICSKSEDGRDHYTVRERRESDSGNSRTHYGVILSASGPMDGRTRDRLAAPCDALCIDTNSLGALDSSPYLQIRGINNYADGYSNDTWQGYAAAAASLYAIELIENIPADDAFEERVTKVFRTEEETIDYTQEWESDYSILQDSDSSLPSLGNTSLRNKVNSLPRLMINCILFLKRGAYQPWTQPLLREGYSRIEWRCECGDFLYADIKENSKGSLGKLAKQLKGTLTISPTQQPAQEPNSPAATSNVQADTTPVMQRGVISSAMQDTANPNTQADSQGISNLLASGSRTIIRDSNATTSTLFLELCIQSSKGIHSLEELDVAGNQTDRDIFSRIRDSYDRIRPPSILGMWKTRQRKGGVFVKFRRDKHPRINGQATASISKRECMPSEIEKAKFDYDFEPVPMDEPPMPVDTFNHYLEKPHSAATVAAWVTRFPKLKGPSLKYSNDVLPQGWGVEIVEVRNWALFAFANAFALFLSGVMAVVFAIFSGDRQTAVAVGAWLTSVQTIVITTLLFLWTSD